MCSSEPERGLINDSPQRWKKRNYKYEDEISSGEVSTPGSRIYLDNLPASWCNPRQAISAGTVVLL